MPVMAAGARTLVRSKVRNGGIYLFVTNFNAIFSISMKTQNTCRWLPALVPGVVLGLVCSLLAIAEVPGAEIELTLQTRDQATGNIILTTEKVDPRHVGVIAVDVWNFH